MKGKKKQLQAKLLNLFLTSLQGYSTICTTVSVILMLRGALLLTRMQFGSNYQTCTDIDMI